MSIIQQRKPRIRKYFGRLDEARFEVILQKPIRQKKSVFSLRKFIAFIRYFRKHIVK